MEGEVGEEGKLSPFRDEKRFIDLDMSSVTRILPGFGVWGFAGNVRSRY